MKLPRCQLRLENVRIAQTEIGLNSEHRCHHIKTLNHGEFEGYSLHFRGDLVRHYLKKTRLLHFDSHSRNNPLYQCLASSRRCFRGPVAAVGSEDTSFYNTHDLSLSLPPSHIYHIYVYIYVSIFITNIDLYCVSQVLRILKFKRQRGDNSKSGFRPVLGGLAGSAIDEASLAV